MERKTPEFKKMMGERMANNDGFTYVYGASKDGPTKKGANASVKRSVRRDKRKVKGQESKRISKEYE